MSSPAEIAIKHAIRFMHASILKDVFLRDVNGEKLNYGSINAAIEEQVIREFVVQDLSALGGKTKYIDLNNLRYKQTNTWTKIYEIPSEMREGRNITHISKVARSIRGGLNATTPIRSSLQGRSHGLMRDVENFAKSNLEIASTSTTEINILNDNVIEVRDVNLVHMAPTLMCKLEISPDLNEVTKPYQNELNKLIECAIKAHVYYDLSVKLDAGKLKMGREFGRYGDIVESYSDASEMYQNDLLPLWRKYLILMDRISSDNFYQRG